MIHIFEVGSHGTKTRERIPSTQTHAVSVQGRLGGEDQNATADGSRCKAGQLVNFALFWVTCCLQGLSENAALSVT